VFRGRRDGGRTKALDPSASSTNMVILDDSLDLSDGAFCFC